MLAATRGDLLYDLVLFGHVLLAIIGGGSLFGLALVRATGLTALPSARRGVDRVAMRQFAYLVDPVLWTTGLIGIVLVLIDDRYEFSQAWISIAFALWLIGGVIGSVMIRRLTTQIADLSERIADGEIMQNSGNPGFAGAGGADRDELTVERGALDKKLSMFSGISHLLFVLLIADMVFKPGL